MAIYHLSSTTISRGKGQSAIASASYRSGEKLYSERYNQTNFYAREVKPVAFILTPKHAPAYASNREKLWNAVERVEKRADAQLAREFNVALPVELNHAEQEELVREYVQENFVNRGMVADVAIHRDDENNPHFHLMTTIRPFNPDGSWGKKAEIIYLFDENGEKQRTENGNFRSRKSYTTDWNNKETLNEWRKNWAESANQYLFNAGSAENISEKSYAERGIDVIPTVHEGYVARQIEEKGKVSDRCELNRNIRKDNYDKETQRRKFSRQETESIISKSLSPKDKSQLKQVAKNLKIYVNYENLIDKERMVNNWENSIKLNQMIKPDGNENSTIEKIDKTKESIQIGKKILENQFTRIYEKYYPEIAKKYNYSIYYKMAIANETLKNDKVLNEVEIAKTLKNARNNEINFVLKNVSKKPYIQSVKSYQERLFKVSKELENFYNKHNIKESDVGSLDNDGQKEFKKLYTQQGLQVKTLKILEQYFDSTIKSKYPTAEVSDMSIRQKESLSKAIDYYGNKFSFETIERLSKQEQINKYSTFEQRMGLSFIEKIDNNSFESGELEMIQSDYRMKEIYDTVSDEEMKKYFIHEAYENGVYSQSHSTDISSFNLSFLAQNSHLYDNLIKASEDNMRKKYQENENKKRLENKRKKGNGRKNTQKAPKI